MTEVRIERKPAFIVAGKKTWISGQDNEQFGRFWQAAHQNGLITRLAAMPKPAVSTVDGGVFGVSCVEKDPACRAFDFFIAAEIDNPADAAGLMCHEIPACTWAVFTGEGELPMSLVRAEMYAMLEWLPDSPYCHAHAPELEVYPAEGRVEFWLPIEEK